MLTLNLNKENEIREEIVDAAIDKYGEVSFAITDIFAETDRTEFVINHMDTVTVFDHINNLDIDEVVDAIVHR